MQATLKHLTKKQNQNVGDDFGCFEVPSPVWYSGGFEVLPAVPSALRSFSQTSRHRAVSFLFGRLPSLHRKTFVMRQSLNRHAAVCITINCNIPPIETEASLDENSGFRSTTCHTLNGSGWDRQAPASLAQVGQIHYCSRERSEPAQ